jgi:hypothetical protein
MPQQPLSGQLKSRLESAARTLRTANPMNYVNGLIEDSFAYPIGDSRYLSNHLVRGAAPFVPKYESAKQRVLSFALEPYGPDASPTDRHGGATHEMRRLVSENFGQAALKWYDQASESERSLSRRGAMNYGAFFGSSFDGDGLHSATITYEGGANASSSINPQLSRLVMAAMAAMPGLQPLFTTLVAGREYGSQWVTFLLTNGFRLVEMQPMLDELGLGQRLAGILQVIGVALGGRFDIPPGAALVAFGRGPEGVSLELHVMLDAIADVPPNFLQLLTMNLRERPRELASLERFLEAFTPEDNIWPGRFSVLTIRIGPSGPPRVGLSLRPVEFEISPAAALMPDTAVPAIV